MLQSHLSAIFEEEDSMQADPAVQDDGVDRLPATGGLLEVRGL